MRLTLKNIGKIKTASIDIKGITVIAGENDTGKSTVSRALFAVFNSFYNIRKQFEDTRIRRIENMLDELIMDADLKFVPMIDTNDIAKTIVSQMDEYRQIDLNVMQSRVLDMFSQHSGWERGELDEETIAEPIARIKDLLEVSETDFTRSMLKRVLNIEFNDQVCNIFSGENGEIRLQIKDSTIIVGVKNDGNISIQNPNNISLRTESVYIDNPFVLDNLGSRVYYRRHYNPVGHREHLLTKLLRPADTDMFDEIIAGEKLNRIYDKISSVCSGNIIRSRKPAGGGYSAGYQKKDSDQVLHIANLSTGLKTFVILKMLLTSGVIERNGTVILDEPEIHLHPEWQLLFAELIVLIQKEFGIHVLLNTHSPYFLNAIEVYSAKHGVDDKCKYYLASTQGDVATIDDVTGCIESIYSQLARPLQDLENERGLL